MLSIAHVVVDCTDAAALATFYAELLDTEVNPGASAYFATVAAAPTLMFIKVGDKTPGKNSVHIDLHAPEWLDYVERAESLGAKRIGEFDEYGAKWVTLADPEGNLFDIGLSK